MKSLAHIGEETTKFIRFISTLVALLMAALMTPNCSAVPEAPRQWRVTELAFSAPRRLVQPLDVVLKANVVGPAGRRLTIEGLATKDSRKASDSQGPNQW